MKLFTIQSGVMERVKIQPFKLEREIQDIVESNLSPLFELEFIKSELTFGDFRFDTLCFDNETNSFVIIEYKKGSSYSVIDQGYTYLSQLLNNKSDFILEYNETLGRNIRRDEVDWSQSKVIFISPQFSSYQKNSVNFKNLPFELWEITRYSNGTIGMNRIHTESDVNIISGDGSSSKKGGKDVLEEVSKEVIRYDEEFHLQKSKNRPDSIVELYYNLKERILNIGEDIELKFNKQTIGVTQNKNFASLEIYNKGIKVVLNLKKGELKDPLQWSKDISEKGHWGVGDYQVYVRSDEDLEYVISLIKQSYEHQL